MNFLHGRYLVNKSSVPILKYLAITAHWIHRDKSTNGLQLCSTLIIFHYLWASHNGARLARIALHLLDWVGVTVKAHLSFVFLPFSTLRLHTQGGHWTLDNASLNDVFPKELEILLHPRKVEFNHKNNHVQSFPPIINICSNHVIKASTKITLVDDTGGFIACTSGPPSDPDNQTYKEAVAWPHGRGNRGWKQERVVQVNQGFEHDYTG